MDFGRATSRLSWCPGQPESWRNAEDFKKELAAKRRGPSWLGKTAEDFAEMARARLQARPGSWIGHREKNEADYAEEAKKSLLREKWIKYIRRMSRKRSFGLSKDQPKTLEEIAREEYEKSLHDGWVKWKRRMSKPREYGVNREVRPLTPAEIRQQERDKNVEMGWIKWKRRLSAKREYGLGRARSITEDERERMRIAAIQEKGWILPYMCDALAKGWVRRYRGSLRNFNLEKSGMSLEKVQQLIEADKLRHLEMEWVKNIRKIQLPKFGLGDTRPKSPEAIADERRHAELEGQWEEHTTKRLRRRTSLGLGPRRSFTEEELRIMEIQQELQDGWQKFTTKGSWRQPGKLVWLPRILTPEELELIRIHTEQEKNWQSAVKAETLRDVFPLKSWPWEDKIKTKEQLVEEKRWHRQETEWLKGRPGYDQLQEGFPTVQDLVIMDLEQVWALEDMEAAVREERKNMLMEFVQVHRRASEENFRTKHTLKYVKKPEQKQEWERIMMYINDKMDVDFEDSDSEDHDDPH